jgi:hypothetical protein
MPKRKPMRVRLGGHTFLLRESSNLCNYGECEISHRRNGTVDRIIRIATWQTEKEALDTWVHEAMHGIWPDKSEEEVARASRDLSRLLWRLGYRRPPGA